MVNLQPPKSKSQHLILFNPLTAAGLPRWLEFRPALGGLEFEPYYMQGTLNSLLWRSWTHAVGVIPKPQQLQGDWQSGLERLSCMRSHVPILRKSNISNPGAIRGVVRS